MKNRIDPLKQFISAAAALGITQAPAAVIITEVLYNEVGSDREGEWIEIYNTGSSLIDLSGWNIGDEEAEGETSATEAMFRFPIGASIAAGEVQIVSMGANRFQSVYGFLPNYEIPTGNENPSVPTLILNSDWDPDGGIINLANSNDQVLLLDSAGLLIDAVSWGSTFAFDPGLDGGAEADGQSYYRIDPLNDTDTAADWAVTPVSTLSTPGVIPGVIPEPSTGILFLTGGLLLLGRRKRKAETVVLR